MKEKTALQVRKTVDELYRSESRRVFATLVRLLGDFDLAEEAMHEAFTAAVEQWQRDGVPQNPRAWLVSTGRFKAIDSVRRRSLFDASLEALGRELSKTEATQTDTELPDVEDDRLRLIFTCCHPALSGELQVALTLREVCGLKTEEIASAFLIAAPTLAQRIVRAKAKIRIEGIPYEVPALADLPTRLDAVLSVIYLVFNEGYSASSGDSLTRCELSEEAIRLGRLLLELLPDSEVMGLLALMLIQESRRDARATADGDVILLEDQDRSLWNRRLIAEGTALVDRSVASREYGSYTIQAAIASMHANSTTAAETDWAQIVAWYDVLLQAEPSSVIELNRAVAVAMDEGPLAGLTLIDAILSRGDLVDYHLAHAARADLCRRLDRIDDAKAAYQQALDLARQEPERRFLEKRLIALK